MDKLDPQNSQLQSRAANLGMWLLIAALGMLFVASLVLYLVFRLTADQWPPPGHPPLPVGWLSISTFILIASGFTIQYALHSVRQGRLGLLSLGLGLTLVLALCFLYSQVMAWRIISQAETYLRGNIYAGTFYMLTFLHAVHVLGGLIPLIVITVQAFLRRFSMSNWQPVKNLVMYWHFLDVVWIAVFLSLLLGG
jgi:cytochrome c oxidase subunit III